MRLASRASEAGVRDVLSAARRARRALWCLAQAMASVADIHPMRSATCRASAIDGVTRRMRWLDPIMRECEDWLDDRGLPRSEGVTVSVRTSGGGASRGHAEGGGQ